jgi:hypothetical protein
MKRLWPVIIGGLVGANIFIAYNLWSIEHQLAQVNNEHSRLQNLLVVKRQQLGKDNNQLGFRFNTDILLKQLQSIVTEDMMFDKLVLDIENKSMQVEGFCVNPNNLNGFLLSLSKIKGINSVDELVSSSQSRADIMGYAFRFIVTFLGDFK